MPRSKRRVLSDIGYGDHIVSPRTLDELERLFFAAVINKNSFVAVHLKMRVNKLPEKIYAHACKTGNLEILKWMTEHLHLSVVDDAIYMCNIALSNDHEVFIWGCEQFPWSTDQVSTVKVQILEFYMRNNFWREADYFVRCTKMTSDEICASGWAYDIDFELIEDDVEQKSPMWLKRYRLYRSWKK